MDPITLMALAPMLKGGLAKGGQGLLGVAGRALPMLIREVVLRDQLKRQRDKHRQLADDVKNSRFGPRAAEMARRDAAVRDNMQRQADLSRQAMERAAAQQGPAQVARMQSGIARSGAEEIRREAVAGAERARQERERDKASKEQQLEDMDYRKNLMTQQSIAELMKGATEGMQQAGRRDAAKRLGINSRLGDFDPELLGQLAGLFG